MDQDHGQGRIGARTGPGRLDTFVDAAFAFSLTLLVISYNQLPDSVTELRGALRRVPVFVVCFALVGMFWNAHRLWRNRHALDDGRSVVLSLALVMVVLIYVYPLRMVMSSFLALLTGGWVPNELELSSASPGADLQLTFLIYSLGFGLMAVLIWRLNVHALRCASGLEPLERYDTASEAGAYALMAGVAAVSAALSLMLMALDLPLSGGLAPLAALPMWTYAGLGIAMPWYWARRGRRRPGQAAGSDDGEPATG
ncbi:MAG: TMEM175 family protein [Lysobacter sp.]